MRAVVMEIYSNHIIVLTRDGQFKKIKKPNNYIEVGMEININGMTNTNFRRIAAIIVIIFLISGFGVSAYAYYTPYGYINIDINPSIEIIYNRFNRILKINGINEDGKNMVDNISDYKNKKVETIVGDIIAETTLDNNDEINVLLTFDKLEDKTIDNVKRYLDEDSKVNVYAVEVPEDDYKQAKDDNVSPGKSALIDEVRKVAPSYKKEKLEEITIDELIEVIEDKIKTEDSKNKSNVKRLRKSKSDNNRNENKKQDKKQENKEKRDKENKKVNANKVNKKTNSNREEIKKEGKKALKETTNNKNPVNNSKNNKQDKAKTKNENDDRYKDVKSINIKEKGNRKDGAHGNQKNNEYKKSKKYKKK
ncbi:anti-sigma-I factor RsgI family protein [Vallitalea sp.]|jgi:hypothetical protein|uniref:anti-sigma-I factor RsgI family protein n=1 Tax=Vallitalea sp. TaxID=1882829 RepID=UPI0026013BE9|nr:anti-sigma factor domain-containing protein [Vallitalea sp.]MCT4688945.1 anti-sigma factor domain-containing protein [Vallitalea sp.]